MLPRHISKAITDFIYHFKEYSAYDEMMLFSLAQFISYGLHRSDVWAPVKNGGALRFFKIDKNAINTQVNFVVMVSAFRSQNISRLKIEGSNYPSSVGLSSTKAVQWMER